jgi:hypothetical protein
VCVVFCMLGRELAKWIGNAGAEEKQGRKGVRGWKGYIREMRGRREVRVEG